MMDAPRFKHLRHPMSWSISARRLFLLTLPVSAVLWLGLMILLAMVQIIRGAVMPLSVFWNAPPRPVRKKIGYYGYGHRQDDQTVVTFKKRGA